MTTADRNDQGDGRPLNSAALLGWGMALILIGAVLLFSALRPSQQGRPPGFVVVASLTVAAGWAMLTAGMVTLASRVDQLTKDRARP